MLLHNDLLRMRTELAFDNPAGRWHFINHLPV
jgi:hypothetical protein